MSAEVETMFSARQIPWHGLGKVTPDVVTAAEAIIAAGLDWAVRKAALWTDAEEQAEFYVKTPDGLYVPAPNARAVDRVDGKYATKRLTDGEHLGVGLGEDYETFQNVEAFDLFDTIVDDGAAKYETAGALFGGKVIFILARLSRDITVAGDQMVPYLLLVTSHDGSTALRMLTTPVRVVCANTLRMALGRHETSWSVRHTQNMKGRVNEAREALALSWKYYDEFEAEVDRLMNQTVTEDDVTDLLRAVFPKKGSEVLHEKALAVRGLYETARTIGDYRGTAWGLLNAVNEWELWTSPTRDESRRLERQARETISGIAMKKTAEAHRLLVKSR